MPKGLPYQEFAALLLTWSSTHHRPMPWKNETNPYLVWLSEIILQQTRVEQGWNYYLSFKNRYPDIIALANAPEDEVLKLWEGLGYYSRARNLLQAAKFIRDRHQGKFPSSYEAIKALKGVGPYTAAAIASFAFGLPHAVVDGNVIRVISRLYMVEEPFDTTAGRKTFDAIAAQLLDKNKPGLYNQAIMDFGANICTPRQPLCSKCPFQASCLARTKDAIERFPVKAKKLVKTHRHFHFLLFQYQDMFYLEKRANSDIWKGLYQFPLVESAVKIEDKMLMKSELILSIYGSKTPEFKNLDIHLKQQLTHQEITASFVMLRLTKAEISKLPSNWLSIKQENLDTFAYPRIIRCFLDMNVVN